MRNRKFVLFIVLLSALSLTACGKRPSKLDPPDRATSQYPRTYPDPKDIEP